MERSQLAIIASIVLAAIGLFSVRFFSNDVELAGGTGISAPGGEDAGVTADGTREAAGHRSGGTSGVTGGRQRGASAADSGGALGPRKPGLPQVARSGSGGSRADDNPGFGKAGSGSRRGPAVDIPITSTSGGGKIAAPSGTRSELVDTLASLPPSVEHGREDPDALFSLPLRNTTEAEDGTQPLNDEGAEPGPDATRFADGAFLTYPNDGQISDRGANISFEFDPEWGNTDPSDNFFFKAGSTWENRVEIFKNGRYFRFLLFNSEGQETGINLAMDDWPPGPHAVDAHWDMEAGEMVLRIDGVERGREPIQGNFNPATLWYLGGDPAGRPAGGKMWDFKIKGFGSQG